MTELIVSPLQTHDPAAAFLAGFGPCGALIAGRDWTGTSLGAIESWPYSLRTALGLVLASAVPMVLLWEEDGVMLYNDAYSIFAGGRHPALLGTKVREGWPEVASFNDQVMTTGLAGGTLSYKTQELTLYRHGRAEQVFMNLDYSPVFGDDGRPTGVLSIVVETTERVMTERRQAFLHALEDRLRTLVEPVDVTAGAAELLGRHLRVGRTGYGEIDVTGEVVVVARDWSDSTMASLAGEARLLDAFGPEVIAELRAGLTLVVEDCRTDPRTCDSALLRTWDSIATRALIVTPLLSADRLVAFLYAHSATPRTWSALEVSLVEDVGARTWAAVQRARAEAALREQAGELLAVLDAVPAGIWITHDPEAHEITGNTRSHEFLRVPLGRNQAKGEPDSPTHHFRFLDPDGREIAPRDLPVQTAARGEPVTDREYRVAFDDGTHIDIFGNATTMRNARGEPAGAVAAFMDITARKTAEAALREETHILETLNRAGVVLAAELDLERVVQQVTDAAVELTGAAFGAFFYNVLNEAGESLMLYTLSGAERASFEQFGMPRATAVFHPTFAGEGVVRSDDILADPRYGQSEPHRGMPENHLPVRSYLAVPVASRSGEVLGGLFFGHPDPGRFTARHERLLVGLAGQAAIAIDNARLFQAVQRANETLEARVAERTDELTQAHEALRQSQKMEAMGQLTGGVAHDFNNLLTPIVAVLDRLQRRGSGEEREQRLIAGAAQSAERAKTLVQRLLAFARRQPLQTTAVDVTELVQGMADLVSSTIGPQIRVVVDTPEDLPPAKADPNQLEMALLNLSVNARDAMPDGGTLRITATAETLPARNTAKLKPGAYIRLSVADSGTGMDEATLARAVEPFFSTKGIGKGTGLGLSMVHGLVSQLDGAMRISSQPGLGTNVEIWLPQSQVSPEAVRSGTAIDPEPKGRGTALLVDDEELVRLSTADMLAELGFEVVEAASAGEALRLLDTGLSPSLLVTDHLMPGMSGTELARQVRETRPEVSILVVSGYAESEGIEPDLPRLTKPFRKDELATALANLARFSS